MSQDAEQNETATELEEQIQLAEKKGLTDEAETEEIAEALDSQDELVSEKSGGIDAHHRSDSAIKSRSSFVPIAATNLQNKASHRIDPDKYGGWFRGYVRQDWNTINVEDGVQELRANWIELFFDLIYVACIVHLSAEVTYSLAAAEGHRRRLAGSTADYTTTDEHDCVNWKYTYIFVAFAQFGMLTNAWRSQVQYITHFVFNQQMDLWLKVWFMVCVLCMGIFLKDDYDYHRGFLWSYAALQVIHMFMFGKVLMIPRGLNHGRWFVGQSFVTLLIVVILLACIDEHAMCNNWTWFGVYLAFYLFDTIAVYSSYIISLRFKLDPRIAIPLNVPHIAERSGLFIMLILGESIISIMSADYGSVIFDSATTADGVPPGEILVIFVIMAFLFAYCIGRLYYDCQPPEEAILEGNNNHALRISAARGRTYMYAHQLLYFGLLGLGMGIKIDTKHLFESKRRWVDVVLPGYSLVVISIGINLIRIAHPYCIADVQKYKKIWVARGVILLIMMIMPLFAKLLNNGVILIVLFVCMFAQLALDVEGRARVQHEKAELKEHREIAKQHTERSEQGGHEEPPMAAPPANLRRLASGIGRM
eukprot:CAMPEP_0197041654 /NCGR_PEP_ID=MMETSP1384-20130603/18170_1 /TAXON_ID=29189 /ORGANISM="Ammonia sp." /LENGTH=590 /DNA_ID=CAMNT_0042472625 /DNA_START=62 /DNA_END=1834 /DNA_ORIENTATION=+